MLQPYIKIEAKITQS